MDKVIQYYLIIDKKSEDSMCKIEYKGNIESGIFLNKIINKIL